MPEAKVAAQVQRGRKLCFVIAPIGEPETEIRRKSDQVLRHLLKPSLEPEYEVERKRQSNDMVDRVGVGGG